LEEETLRDEFNMDHPSHHESTHGQRLNLSGVINLKYT
jgi:hypothetical protein